MSHHKKNFGKNKGKEKPLIEKNLVEAVYDPNRDRKIIALKGAFYSQAKTFAENYREIISSFNPSILNYNKLTKKNSEETPEEIKKMRESLGVKIRGLMKEGKKEYNFLDKLNTKIFHEFLYLTDLIFLYDKVKINKKNDTLFLKKEFIFSYKTNIIKPTKGKGKHPGFVFNNDDMRTEGEKSINLIPPNQAERYIISDEISNKNDTEFTLEAIIKNDPVLSKGRVSSLKPEQLDSIGLKKYELRKGLKLSDLTLEQLSKIGVRFKDVRSYFKAVPCSPKNNRRNTGYFYYRARKKNVESIVNKMILKAFGTSPKGKIKGKVSNAEGISDTLGITFVTNTDEEALDMANKFAAFFGQKLSHYNVKYPVNEEYFKTEVKDSDSLKRYFNPDRLNDPNLDGVMEYKHYEGHEKETGRSARQIKVRYSGAIFDIHCVSKKNQKESTKDHGLEYKKERNMMLTKILKESAFARDIYNYLTEVYTKTLDSKNLPLIIH